MIQTLFTFGVYVSPSDFFFIFNDICCFLSNFTSNTCSCVQAICTLKSSDFLKTKMAYFIVFVALFICCEYFSMPTNIIIHYF